MKRKSAGSAASGMSNASASATRGAEAGSASEVAYGVPDEHALWLGRFLVQMSTIEHQLEALIWELAAMPFS